MKWVYESNNDWDIRAIILVTEFLILDVNNNSGLSK